MKIKSNSIPAIKDLAVKKALPSSAAEQALLTFGCQVDHEGFDLNEIEQLYYKRSGIGLYHDRVWYKDGGQERGTNSVLHTWIESIGESDKLIIDHSHFVFRYEIGGEAADQIKEYTKQRPELIRLLSTNFKCGLDFCVDYLGETRVEPIVHIEWDYDNLQDLEDGKKYVEYVLTDIDWDSTIKHILRYNVMARDNKITAFEQADFRSMLLFGKKSYKLIPTL